MSDQPSVLRALPTGVIEVEDGVRLRRGCVDVRVSGDHASEIVHHVLAAAAGEGSTRDEICGFFRTSERDEVRELLEEFERRGILVPADDDFQRTGEDALDVFYWHFGQRKESVNARLASANVAIVGVNPISKQLVECLSEAGVAGVAVIDDGLPSTQRVLGRTGAVPSDWAGAVQPVPVEEWRPTELVCVVATTDFGGARTMRHWNDFCLRRPCHFLPVVLQDLVGFVGPLVVPGETACFECMLARWRSNTGELESRWEALDLGDQHAVGVHPAMADILGAIAAFELTKFYGLELPFTAVGRLIEVNLLTMEMESRRVLRVPRCPACSPLNDRPQRSLARTWFGFAADVEE